jgi:hypothetical protein
LIAVPVMMKIPAIVGFDMVHFRGAGYTSWCYCKGFT